MEKDLSFLKNTLIAHRGVHNNDEGIPENSLKAFQDAIDKKLIIELDLHILKDDTIVVFHDDNLSRMTGINWNIKDLTYEEIKNIKLKNTEYHIPLFSEVLELVDGKVPLLIELKTDVSVGRLEKATVQMLKDYNGKFAIQSFSPFSINWFRKNAPEIIRGQLSDNMNNRFIIERWFLKNMLFNSISKPDFISYGINSLPNKKVSKFHKTNLVLGWTIRNNNNLEHAKQYCDNFICENFEELNI